MLEKKSILNSVYSADVFFLKPSMLNYCHHHHRRRRCRHQHFVVLITADACLAEWYPGLRQMSDFAI